MSESSGWRYRRKVVGVEIISKRGNEETHVYKLSCGHVQERTGRSGRKLQDACECMRCHSEARKRWGADRVVRWNREIRR